MSEVNYAPMVGNLLRRSQNIFHREQTNILSAATVITAAVFLAGIIGVIRNRLLNAYFYKPELLSHLDAYWAAFRLPDTVFQLLVIGALSAAFIPVFTRYLHKDKAEAYHIASATTTLILLIFSVASLIIFIFAYPLSRFIAPKFSAEQTLIMANLTRIMIIAQLFFAMSNFLTGIIQTHHRFLIPALSPLVYNLGIILGTIILSPLIGIYGPAVGVVLGAFLHLMIQWPLSRHLGYRFKLTWDPHHPGVAEIGHLMLPRTLALGITQIELTVMVYLATALASGSLTIFYLAQQLMNLPIRLFGLPIGQASFPFLAKDQSTGEKDKFSQTLIRSLLQILYISLPASALLLVLRIPLVRIAYGVKNFPWQATILTGKVVAILVLSVFAQAMSQILVRAYYALHDTKTPLVIGALSTVMNICLGLLFIFYFDFGILGLAAALSFSSLFQGLALAYLITRRLTNFSFSSVLLPFGKMITATMLTGICLWIPLRLLDRLVFDTTRTVSLIGLTAAVSVFGIIVYFGFSKLLKIAEIEAFTSIAHRLGNWKQVLSQSEEVLESSPQPQQ